MYIIDFWGDNASFNPKDFLVLFLEYIVESDTISLVYIFRPSFVAAFIWLLKTPVKAMAKEILKAVGFEKLASDRAVNGFRASSSHQRADWHLTSLRSSCLFLICQHGNRNQS